MRMHNPPHPGEIIKLDCLDPLELSVTEGAKVLGVTRQTLSNLINRRAGISPEMAIRLEKAFGSDAETWLRLQMNFDIWNARQREDEIRVERCVAA
jgi:addiction module HigA family antidote